MKNTICEKLMWSAMTPAIFKYIAAKENSDDLCGRWDRGHRFYDSGRLVESGRGNEDGACGDTVG